MNGIVWLVSLIANSSNVLLDDLAIVRWGWESTGAGVATAMSQYLALFVGVMALGLSIEWKTLTAAWQKVLNWKALKATIVFNGNVLIRFLVLISAYSIFTNLSATLGTMILAENGLLLQIALLSQFTVNGVGMTTQTLTGNFKGQGTNEQMKPLLAISLLTSLPIALAFAMVSILFPQTVFGLLTNHSEVSAQINSYVGWLLPLLTITAIAFMLEGYFIGLKEGVTLRNGSLLAFGLGFLPMAGIAWYLNNNHLLWVSLVLYMATVAVFLGVQLPKTLDRQVQVPETLVPLGPSQTLKVKSVDS